MTLKLAQGWQVMLADLSLILFLSTAAALDARDASDPAPAAVTAAALAQESAAPVGVYRAGGETQFSDWLASRGADPREQLTVLARHTDGGRDRAIRTSQALATVAAARGVEARIIVEPGAEDEVLALFAFTAEDPQMARKLLQEAKPAPAG